MKKVYRIGIAAGLIPSIFKTILFAIGYNETFGGSYTNLAELAVIALAIPIAVFIARRENDGMITFNNAIKTGIGTTAIAAVVVCIFTFIYFKFMNTAVLDNAVNEAVKYALEKKLDVEETKKTIEGAKQVFSPFVQATSALFGIMLTGFFVSVISAVALKKE